MDCDVSPLSQAAANARTCPPLNSIDDRDVKTDAAASFDDPPLETCKRELEAVLASLDV